MEDSSKFPASLFTHHRNTSALALRMIGSELDVTDDAVWPTVKQKRKGTETGKPLHSLDEAALKQDAAAFTTVSPQPFIEEAETVRFYSCI